MTLLVVAGEPSGDRALGAVLDALDSGLFSSVFGVGGEALAARGVERVADVASLSGLGLVEVVATLPALARAVASLRRAVERRRPRVALLASWSTPNARIGRWLRRRGVRVVWVSPPEIWAWGAWRARSLFTSADRFAFTLPFEPDVWRANGLDASRGSYVGHPSMCAPYVSRDDARRALEIAPDRGAIAILPGSRATEIRALAEVSIEAAVAVRARRPDVALRVLAAPSLAPASRAHLVALAARHGIAVHHVSATTGAVGVLSAFDAAIVASGTASLECAIAGASPTIAYAVHPLTLAIARALVRTELVALPNIVLGRACFPERIQRGANAHVLAGDLETLLDRRSEFRASCAEVRARLEVTGDGFAREVARIVGEEARSTRAGATA